MCSKLSEMVLTVEDSLVLSDMFLLFLCDGTEGWRQSSVPWHVKLILMVTEPRVDGNVQWHVSLIVVVTEPSVEDHQWHVQWHVASYGDWT